MPLLLVNGHIIPCVTCLTEKPPAPPTLQVYPERMAVLPPNVFQTLVSTLQFGVGATGDDEVTQARQGMRLLMAGWPANCHYALLLVADCLVPLLGMRGHRE